MRKKGRNCYNSRGGDRSSNGNKSGGGGDGMVKFNGHDSNSRSFNKRKMLGRRLKGGAFYSH